jgi:hypothetical protein
MKEHEIRDYLYDHPEVLFPSGNITEKAREYSIHRKRVDLLLVVDGVRHIVEIKNVPIQRDHIGQVVEYYGLMRQYMQAANLAMVLVSPSIPAWRAAYLEELGIRCVELPTIPTEEERDRIQKESRSYTIRAKQKMEVESVLGDRESVSFEDVAGPVTPKSAAFARRMLRDSLESIRKSFREYEILPFCITRPSSLDFHVELGPDQKPETTQFMHGGTWWAYRFGFSENSPKNNVPNVSVIANAPSLDVTINAELQTSQEVMLSRIKESTSEFNRLLTNHGGLWLQAYLKYEHQPRFYHWILADRRSPGQFDGWAIRQMATDHERAFVGEREQWIRHIKAGNRELTEARVRHLEAQNKQLNLAIRLVQPFQRNASFWSLPCERQISELVSAVQRMKPLIDFFIR